VKTPIRLMFVTLMPALAFCSETPPPNTTLRKAIESLAPDVRSSMISATIVRTIYEPHGLRSNEAARVQRTIVSETIINATSVRESVCDTSIAKNVAMLRAEEVKHYVNFYANDADNLYAYDGTHCIGLTRNVPKTANINPLLNLLDPLAAIGTNRFISRIVPCASKRLLLAQITRESGEGEKITLRGDYRDSDPERYLTLMVNASLDYAIVDLWEYDRNHRLLSEMHASDLIELKGGSTHLIVPSHRTVKRYIYDDYEGDTYQVATLDILKPKETASVTGDRFWRYSDRALVYDAVNNINLGRAKLISQLLANRGIDAMKPAGSENGTGGINEKRRDGSSAYDMQPQAILARADSAYKEHQDAYASVQDPNKRASSPEDPNATVSRSLQLPRARSWHLFPLLGIGVIGSLLIVLGAKSLCRMRVARKEPHQPVKTKA
jgi:hypothetical protein